MWSSLWIVLIITAIVDCLGQRKSDIIDRSDQLREEPISVADVTRQDLESLQKTKGLPSNITTGDLGRNIQISTNELDFDDENSIEDRVNDDCIIKNSCTLANGRCVKKRKDCDGTVDARGCRGKGCKCCIPKKACSHPWKTIPGGGDRCYWFSKDENYLGRNWTAARNLCMSLGGELATGGYREATYGDPLLDYIHTHSHPSYTFIGAIRSGSSSSWKWLDGRDLSISSSLWAQNEPTDARGDCVAMYNEDKRAVYKEIWCLPEVYYVCEDNIHK